MKIDGYELGEFLHRPVKCECSSSSCNKKFKPGDELRMVFINNGEEYEKKIAVSETCQFPVLESKSNQDKELTELYEAKGVLIIRIIINDENSVGLLEVVRADGEQINQQNK